MNFLHKKIAKLRCSEKIVFYSIIAVLDQQSKWTMRYRNCVSTGWCQNSFMVRFCEWKQSGVVVWAHSIVYSLCIINWYWLISTHLSQDVNWQFSCMQLCKFAVYYHRKLFFQTFAFIWSLVAGHWSCVWSTSFSSAVILHSKLFLLYCVVYCDFSQSTHLFILTTVIQYQKHFFVFFMSLNYKIWNFCIIVSENVSGLSF